MVAFIGGIANISPSDIADVSVLKAATPPPCTEAAPTMGRSSLPPNRGQDAPEGVTANLGFNYQLNSPVLLTRYQDEYAQGSQGVYSQGAVQAWGPRMSGQIVPHWSNDPDYLASVGGEYALAGQPNNLRDFFQVGHTLAASLGVNIKNENSTTHFNYTHTDGAGIIPGNDLTSHLPEPASKY